MGELSVLEGNPPGLSCRKGRGQELSTSGALRGSHAECLEWISRVGYFSVWVLSWREAAGLDSACAFGKRAKSNIPSDVDAAAASGMAICRGSLVGSSARERK